MRALRIFAVVAVLVAGCVAEGPRTPDPAAEAQREPFEQTFGPEYPARPPAGEPVRIDTAELSADQRILTITFVGGKAYLASDPCSEDYEPWVALVDDELDVTVINVERPDQATLGPNIGCTLEGYGHTYHLTLSAAFTGTTVRDQTGGILFVTTPPGAMIASDVPTGWSVQRSFEQEPGPPPIWVEVYAATPVGDQPFEGPGRLVLYEAFGASGEWRDTRAEKSRERGGVRVAVTMNGASATVWSDAASGELLLAWTLGGHSVGLVGNSSDMTPEQLVTYAESVSAPQ
jgi:hypothetical protein